MMYLPHALSFAAGFLSLSQEILWTRLIGFSLGGVPQAFAFVLATYLLGIALGADIGKDLCRRAAAAAPADRERTLLRTCGWVLVVAAGIDAVGPWIFAVTHGSLLASGVACMVMITTALAKSVLFPIVHQLGAGSNASRLGRGFSRVYFANIIGSTCGPLLTGFILLDLVSLQAALALVAVVTGVIGLSLLLLLPAPRAALMPAVVPKAASRRQEFILRAFTPPPRRGLVAGGGIVTLLAAVATVGPGNLIQTVVTNGYARNTELSSTTIRHLIENRHGIVHTLADDRRGDVVFGDGVYDGRINLDLATNANRIDRAYIAAAIKHDARRILVIGLSAGPWTRLLLELPNVERVDAIEINPGYVELITRYPVVRPLLADPRLVVHVDDGRRWLKRHPDARYDLIVMNTSVSWRAYATNLLSRDFLEIARRHLNPGGVVNYNASVSDDAVKTATAVFAHVRRYTNSVLASDTPFLPQTPEIERRLQALTLDGKPLLAASDPKLRAITASIAAGPFVTTEEIERQAKRKLEIITDRNMITEFKYGRSDFAAYQQE